MKYKVGNEVKIKSLNWYKANKNSVIGIDLKDATFIENMSKYCGTKTVITEIANSNRYKLAIDNGRWYWTDDMLDSIPKSKKQKTFKKENCNLRERAELTDIFGNKIVLSGRHAFEWSITTYKEEGITRITFSCRKDAKKEFESIKKKNKL